MRRSDKQVLTPWFSFFGEGFHFDNIMGRGDQGALDANCMPCAAGETFTLSAVFAAPLGQGNAAFNGQTYSGAYYTSGQLEFTTPEMTIPGDGRSFAQLNAPFTFMGTLGASSDLAGYLPLFTAELNGSGFAHLLLVFDGWSPEGVPLYNLDTLEYSFLGRGSEPVPEPATMLMLGLGVAGAAARVRAGSSRSSRQSGVPARTPATRCG